MLPSSEILANLVFAFLYCLLTHILAPMWQEGVTKRSLCANDNVRAILYAYQEVENVFALPSYQEPTLAQLKASVIKVTIANLCLFKPLPIYTPVKTKACTLDF